MFRCNNPLITSCRAMLAVLVITVCASAAPDTDPLGDFLTRLGLVELHTVHLEQVLAEEQDDARRLALAKRLADVYAGQLLAHSDNAAKYESVVEKIQALLERVPAAKTPLLDVMLLQADYYRAEKLVGKWVADRSDTSLREDAKAILDRIAPQLNQLHTELNSRHEALLDEINALQRGDEMAVKEQQLERLLSIVGRASYFAAWSSYYRGLINNSSDDYATALKMFRQILGLGDSYDEVQAEDLGLASIWRSRALIGLGLTEAAMNHPQLADRCFELLTDVSVPPQLRDQTSYWRLQSLLNVERYADALAFAQEQIAAFSGGATQGQVSFCVSLIQAAYATGLAATPQTQPLGMLGFEGLIKMGQLGTARQLMAKYEITPGEEAGFYLRWLQGQQLFEQAERTGQDADYATAAAILTQALRDPAANEDLGSAGRCRNHLAWCHFRQDNFEAAGRDFQLAAERLLAARDESAVDAAWMSFVAFQAASKSAPRFQDAAIEMLQTIKREFPNHKYARRADYYIGKLRQSSSPIETLRNLENVSPDSPDYLAARYDITNILHQQWQQADAERRADLAKQLYEATDTYVKLVNKEADKSRVVRALTRAAGVAMGGTETKPALAERYLAQAGSLAADLRPDHPAAAEFHASAMQLARNQGDAAQEQTHAGWLVNNATGSRYELPAVIVMARTLDQQIAKSSAPRTEQLRRALDLYKRLVDLLGDTPDAIRASKNAQVANSKLAHYAMQLGRPGLAAERLASLLAAGDGPPSKSYLRRAGLAHFAAQDYSTALDHWRTLVRGLPKGSDAWFEAKYYQLACLFQGDPEAAGIVYDQFKLLYPDLGPPAWRDKFEALR